VAALHGVLGSRGADFKQQGLQKEDGQELIGMLGGRQGQQVSMGVAGAGSKMVMGAEYRCMQRQGLPDEGDGRRLKAHW
jgi:hypothetical protein